MTLPPLLRPSFWFSPMPPPFMPWVDRALPIIFALLFVAGIIVYLIAFKQNWDKMMRRALRKAADRLAILGCVGLLLYALSYERIYVLSARVGYLLWLALLAWYAWTMYKLVTIEMPAMEQRQAEREQKNKWLPKSKK